MVPDQIESRARAHLRGLLQRKQMIARGKAVLPVFGTLAHVLWSICDDSDSRTPGVVTLSTIYYQNLLFLGYLMSTKNMYSNMTGIKCQNNE